MNTLSSDPSYLRQPPAGGLAAVVSRGVALRQRRRAAASGGLGAGALLAVGLLVAVPGQGPSSLEQLPARQPTVTPAAPPSTSVPAPTPVGPVASPVGPLTPASSAPPGARPTGDPSPPATARPSESAPTGLQPWHRPVRRDRLPEGAGSVCEAPTGGWCVAAHVVGTASSAAPATLGLDVCRAASAVTEGRLEFADDQELEVTVGDETWRWSAGVALRARPHTLTIGAGVCLRWSTTWNATTSEGRPVAFGSYSVTTELVAEGSPRLAVAFDVRVDQ